MNNFGISKGQIIYLFLVFLITGALLFFLFNSEGKSFAESGYTVVDLDNNLHFVGRLNTESNNVRLLNGTMIFVKMKIKTHQRFCFYKGLTKNCTDWSEIEREEI